MVAIDRRRSQGIYRKSAFTRSQYQADCLERLVCVTILVDDLPLSWSRGFRFISVDVHLNFGIYCRISLLLLRLVADKLLLQTWNWLVGGLVAIFIFPLILGMSSSQLTKSYFSEGWVYNHQPVGVCSLNLLQDWVPNAITHRTGQWKTQDRRASRKKTAPPCRPVHKPPYPSTRILCMKSMQTWGNWSSSYKWFHISLSLSIYIYTYWL